MCRLFAVRAATPVRVDRAFAGLRELAHEHKDGWGIARFDAESPVIERNLDPAHASSRFAELGGTLETCSLLAHIRLASVGRVRPENAHPFFARGWAFVHNGTLRGFEEHRARLEAKLAPACRSTLRGETDSERCFGLFLTALDGVAEPSLEDVARALAHVVRVAASFDLPSEPKPSTLNFMVTDGARTVATRQGKELFELSTPGARYLASQPLWPDAWQEVPEQSVVAIGADLSVHHWTIEALAR